MIIYKNRELNICEDLLGNIWSFVSFTLNPHLLIINKYYYSNYRKDAKITNLNSYIRFLIRNDYNFLFSFLLNNKLLKKVNLRKKYKYKKETYKNYIHFLNYLCIYYDSNKCKFLVNDFYK